MAAAWLRRRKTSAYQLSLWREAWRRLRRNRLASLSVLVIMALSLLALGAEAIAPYHYTQANFLHAYEFPSRAFPFGTDPLGRDMLSRIVYGARVSMLVGVVAQLLIVLIGVPVGAVSGFCGGKVDLLIMRFVDVMYAFPRLLFVILLMSMLGPGLRNIFIAIGLTGWVNIARLTRAQILFLKSQGFSESARALGASGLWVLTRHLLPNSLTPIIVAVTFGIPEAMFTEAALSFIGVGINPPTPSWGQMVGEYQQYILSYWHLCTFPALAIAVTMLAFTFLGDGLRDALDPTLRD